MGNRPITLRQLAAELGVDYKELKELDSDGWIPRPFLIKGEFFYSYDQTVADFSLTEGLREWLRDMQADFRRGKIKRAIKVG